MTYPLSYKIQSIDDLSMMIWKSYIIFESIFVLAICLDMIYHMIHDMRTTFIYKRFDVKRNCDVRI